MNLVALAWIWLASYSLLFITAAQPPPAFRNPLLPSGPDPWVLQHDGFYYYMNTTSVNLTLWKTRDITDLAHAQRKIVWQPPLSGPNSHELWAPELHYIAGRWYIYFAADAGTNAGHRIWVLENASGDPLQGEWKLRGKIAEPSDRWAIDPTVFENGGRWYLVWSGWEGATDGQQNLYIAAMATPWMLATPRVRISTPDRPWEKVGDLDPFNQILAVPHVDVNEAPEIIRHGDRIYLVYSASGCWTNYYELGLLTASVSSDLLNPASWTKAPGPVFWQSPESHAFGPGHNSFFKSPDGREDWIIYHANPEANEGCGDLRSPRAQPFHWNRDGSPNLGRPVALGQPVQKPSGTLP